MYYMSVAGGFCCCCCFFSLARRYNHVIRTFLYETLLKCTTSEGSGAFSLINDTVHQISVDGNSQWNHICGLKLLATLFRVFGMNLNFFFYFKKPPIFFSNTRRDLDTREKKLQNHVESSFLIRMLFQVEQTLEHWQLFWSSIKSLLKMHKENNHSFLFVMFNQLDSFINL